MTGVLPCLFEKGATGAEVPFHSRITENCMVFQDQLETNLLQLFAHPQNSEWFSTIFAIIFEAKNFCCSKQVQLVTIFVFYKFPLPSTLFLPPCPSAVPASLFTRNTKHGFHSWKWSNLAWTFSSRLTIYFSNLALCGLELPLREKHSFSLGK